MGKHRHSVSRDLYIDEDCSDDEYYYEEYLNTKNNQNNKNTPKQPEPKQITKKTEEKKPKTQLMIKKTNKLSIDQLNNTYKTRETNSLNISIIGHVDAGKSTLIGHLLHKLEIFSDKKLRKTQREAAQLGRSSFAFAFCLDEMNEERERGITMDVGIVDFSTDKLAVNALDTPGHVDFIPKMIEATSLADVVVLIVSAANGEFESGFDGGGQTREHITISRSLDVKKIIVVINKMDSVDWSEVRFKTIEERVGDHLKTIGYDHSVFIFIPCSAFLGHNLFDETSIPPQGSWYKGMNLLESIDSMKIDRNIIEEPCRCVVINVRKKPNRGNLTIQGVVRSGQLQNGDVLTIFPSKIPIVAKALSVIGHPNCNIAFVGDFFDLDFDVARGSVEIDETFSVDEVNEEHISVGNVISSLGDRSQLVSVFKARIHTFRVNLPITPGFTCELYCNGSSGSVVLTKIVKVIKCKSDLAGKSRFLSSNSSAVVELECLMPVYMVVYKECTAMGKFILLYNANTLGVGIVTEIVGQL